MTDAELAVELIDRLNALCENDSVRSDIGRILCIRAPCSQPTVEHPTIQTGTAMTLPGMPKLPGVSMLGILNGLVGAHQNGEAKGSGYIAAIVRQDGQLHGFCFFGESEYRLAREAVDAGKPSPMCLA